MRAPISVEEKVACTLRYLATGEDFTSLSFHSGFIELLFQALSPRFASTFLKF